MKFYQVREKLLQGENLINIPLRVTFYARVSTDKEEQLNSLDNQINYYKEYINNNKNWTYINGYIDEAISGTTAKRKNFQKMIDDSKKDLFDLIITKEVSRFSRNLFDSIKYTQELMLNNVGVYFQTNEINTYDLNSEFILNMMSSLAQEESKRLSTRIKWGHKNSIKRGRILGNKITGYYKKNTQLIINEEEAKKIKRIFELYATNKYGLTKLAYILREENILNSKGNIYDKDTLKRIIQNPKYKGYYRGHTTEIVDYKTKKKIKIPKEEQIIYKDNKIPVIVSEELWDKANKILEKRSKKVIEKQSINSIIKKYAYTKKIICKEHKTTFQRLTGKKNNNNPRWVCNEYLKYGIIECKTPIIYEKDLNKILKQVIIDILPDQNIIIEKLLTMYKNVFIRFQEQEQNKIKNAINDIKKKKENLLELTLNNYLSKEEFKLKNIIYNEEIKKLKENLTIIKSNINLSLIETNIIKELTLKNIDDYIKIILNKIEVSKINNSRNNIRLDIYLLKSNNYKLLNIGNYKSNINNYIYYIYVDSSIYIGSYN